jgi:hypothetical protein
MTHAAKVEDGALLTLNRLNLQNGQVVILTRQSALVLP